MQVPKGKWTCDMNDDPTLASCDMPQELKDEEIDSQMVGAQPSFS